jgi:spermidine synthase
LDKLSEGIKKTDLALHVVLTALFLSGVSGIINQVVWQRALKIFLGGSETISSLVVVLVFMLGLGIGSGIMGERSRGLVHPLRSLGFVELGLFAVNAVIAILLSLDLGQSIYAAQRLALSADIPLRLVYAVGALCMLLPPTILMGATLPLAAEACQRQLGATESKLISILFALNTVGACVGAVGSSFYLLPYFGQRTSLLVAAIFNLAAGASVVMLSLCRRGLLPSSQTHPKSKRFAHRPLSLEEILGTALGFLSLGYEMYLLRLVSLAHEPLPYTFAYTLFFFLLFWSIGVWLAGKMQEHFTVVLVIGAVLVASMPGVYAFDRWQEHFVLFRGGLIYFLPCVCFGLLYGAFVSRAASEWGRDVGRFCALNTIGSCLGILFFTLVGYEIRHDYNAVLIATGLIVVLLQLHISGESASRPRQIISLMRLGQAVLGLLGIIVLGIGLRSPYSSIRDTRTFWGRDGVVEVQMDGDIWIDGLWHSHLSIGESHIDDRYTWMMAVAAVLAHRDEPITNALVVGNGIGITAATLAKLQGLEVDAYEINHTLAKVFQMYPAQTLHSAENPRIHIRWRDGRSGLALDSKQYDVIISAPLHLRAAGCSILLSREYLELARKRLKKNGVFTLYSHEGPPEQAELVRATVRSVFTYVETFSDGLITVASDTPIEITARSISQRLRRDDPLYREMAEYDKLLLSLEEGSLFARFDSDRLPIRPSKYLVTDDHPLVEYPEITARLLREPTATNVEGPVRH